MLATLFYLRYGFMATSEPQKNLINEKPGLVIAFSKLTSYLHNGHVFRPCERLTGN